MGVSPEPADGEIQVEPPIIARSHSGYVKNPTASSCPSSKVNWSSDVHPSSTVYAGPKGLDQGHVPTIVENELRCIER